MVFVEHPTATQNRGYDHKYERYVKTRAGDSVKFYRIKDFNECEVFKLRNYASPTVLYFRAGAKATPAELDIRQDMAANSSLKEAFGRLDAFVRDNASA